MKEQQFKGTINCNKYEPKEAIEQWNQYFDFLINPSFQGVNRLFSSFKNNNSKTSYTRYYLPLVEIYDYNAMINERNSLHQPVKNELIAHENTQKIATGQGNDYATGCLLVYLYFKNY